MEQIPGNHNFGKVITWDEAEELALDRAEWRQHVASAPIWMHLNELRSKERTAARHKKTWINNYRIFYVIKHIT